MIRLRQVVIAARDLEPAVAALRRALPLGEPYNDPGVAHFGLVNAVMALGDTFLEVVTPVTATAPATRFLERRGEGGYMVILQLSDLEAARARLSKLGARVVWQNDLPDISGTHVHPKDLPGAIVSLDAARPPETWHWAGPAWTGRTPERLGPGRVTGATFHTPDPEAAARRWSDVLGVAAADREIPLEGGRVRFLPGAEEGVASFQVALPAAARAGRDRVEVAGTLFDLEQA